MQQRNFTIGNNTVIIIIMQRLSVSVESSPVATTRTLRVPGAPKKHAVVRRYGVETSDTDTDNDSGESVSPCMPRNLSMNFNFASDMVDFINTSINTAIRTGAREVEVSPCSTISPLSLSDSPGLASGLGPEETVGDCTVCYDALPLRSNHVFTQCGHLFCVKCFISWTDTSVTCPMCRAKIIESSAHDNDNDNGGDGDVEEWIHTPQPARAAYNGESEIDSDDDNHNDNDNDNDLEGGYDYSYLHIAQDAELVSDTSFDMQTDPEYGDEQSNLSTMELELIQYNRLVVSCVFLRNRFHETLFSDSIWGGMVQYTLIPKVEWLQIWENVPLYTQRAPSQMFEFVIRRNSEIFRHHRPDEVNTFGYIIGATEVTNDEFNSEFNSRVSFAFDVMVVSPTVPLGHHNIADGIIQTEHLTLTFNDIRRMYYMTSVETHEV